MKPIALSLHGLTAGYAGHRAIENINVEIRQGERVGLIGPNGAGKSTLFKAIVGLLPPLRGYVLINGKTDRQSRQEAAYVPQFEAVDWNFPVSVLDVVVMGLARQVGWFRLPRNKHRQRAMEALERVGMAQYARRQIGELSGGQKRRTFIARALAQGANILLLDEPFTGVDHLAQQSMFEILDGLRTDGVTTLLATHDLNLAMTHFDRLFVLNRELVAYGKPDEVFKPEILLQAFSGQIAVWQGEKPMVMLTDHHCC